MTDWLADLEALTKFCDRPEGVIHNRQNHGSRSYVSRGLVGRDRDIEQLRLGTVAPTSHVFGPLTDYDRSLKKFRDEVNDSPNLAQEDHRLLSSPG
ncbi:MAG TPA: hypothetical protein VFE20_06380 [Thermoleophilia bacterium]|nr:hypothetical protein [Thermoleophilia bacterium]